MDATRISDNKLVYIKRVATDGDELKIALLLNSEPLKQDPRNHCAHVLDHFQDPEDSTMTYMVMPFLRPLDDPAMNLVDDVVVFVDQMLEARTFLQSDFLCADVVLKGLVFLHEHGIAHRYVSLHTHNKILTLVFSDCEAYNILMDADALYPRGYHPVNLGFLPDASHVAPRLRREHSTVRYYYADFGLSSHIPPDSPDKLVVGEFGREQDVPELSSDVPYDPFKVDVFIIGSLFKKHFVEVWTRRTCT